MLGHEEGNFQSLLKDCDLRVVSASLPPPLPFLSSSLLSRMLQFHLGSRTATSALDTSASRLKTRYPALSSVARSPDVLLHHPSCSSYLFCLVCTLGIEAGNFDPCSEPARMFLVSLAGCWGFFWWMRGYLIAACSTGLRNQSSRLRGRAGCGGGCVQS